MTSNQARFATILFLLMISGCQSEKTSSLSNNKNENTQTKLAKTIDLSLGLNWTPEAEHGGYYAALVHGYFREEGLNVTIQPGRPTVPVIADVAAGKCDFGVDNADKVLLLRAQQADVVVVMSPIQNSPRCIMVHKKSGFSKLDDLANAKDFTLALNSGQPFAQFLLKKLNLKGVRMVPFPSGIAGFMQETNYGQQAYSFSEPFLAEEKGGDPQCLMLSDIDFNTYTSVLFARRDTIDQKSEIVEKMTRASIRGWKKYLTDPDETNKHIHEQNPDMGLAILAYGAKALRSACLPEGTDENRLGEMTTRRWHTLVKQMEEIDAIKPGATNADDAYTLKYIQ